MNEFFKTLSLKIKLDDTSVKNTKETLDTLVDTNGLSKDASKSILSDLRKIEQTSAMLDKLQKDLKTIQKLDSDAARQAEKSIKGKIRELGGTSEGKALLSQSRQAFFLGKLTAISTKFLSGLKNTFSDALDELKSMTSYSRMTDSNVRELKLGYGFSSSQAYGYDKAMGMLGISSMEDLMWADSQQLAQFQRLFEKYTEYYEETMTPEYVEKQLEYQIAMEEFKMDLQNSVITFFMDNQDTIMSLMDLSMGFMEFVMSALDLIVGSFSDKARSDRERSRETSSILGAYSASTKNTTVNQTNNFNNVSKQDQSWLANSGQMSYKQIVDYLNRG